MKPLHKGLLLAALQLVMVLSLGAKLLIDRATLPRIWIRTAPSDPILPIRGRYVNLRLRIDSLRPSEVALLAGRSAATLAVPFFIPEHVPDPSRRAPGEELWVEVTVPKKGFLRPIRLGVRKDGVLTPLALN